MSAKLMSVLVVVTGGRYEGEFVPFLPNFIQTHVTLLIQLQISRSQYQFSHQTNGLHMVIQQLFVGLILPSALFNNIDRSSGKPNGYGD